MRILRLILWFCCLAAAASAKPPQPINYFVYTHYSGLITGGVSVLAWLAGVLAGIAAGVCVWRKVRRYFQ